MRHRFVLPATFCFILLLFPFLSAAQQDDYYVVDEIIFEGNEKTNEDYLLRELTFSAGDTVKVEELSEELKWSRILLLRTSLFNSVLITPLDTLADRLIIKITLTERWYILPIPSLQLADRNFNEWWEEYDHDLNRLIYGLDLSVNNLWGNNEQLRIGAYGGFNQRLNIRYVQPYFHPKTKFGGAAEVEWSRSRELAADTRNDKLHFMQGDDFLQRYFKSRLSLTYRSHPFISHALNMTFHQWLVTDEIVFENPDYLGKGKTDLRYFSFGYGLEWNKTDHPSYPLKGHSVSFSFIKKGLGLLEGADHSKFNGRMEWYYQLGDQFFLENTLSAGVTLPAGQSYIFRKALGYGKDFIRGYELYVVDGPHYILNKNTFKWKFWDFQLSSPLLMIEQFQHIPFAWYATLFFDHGYTAGFDKGLHDNQLPDRWLYGFGAGIDIVTYYDYYVSISFAINHMGQKGVFLHIAL